MIALRTTVFVLLLATYVHAFEEPEDFRGMKWGVTVEEANQIIQSQWDKRRQSGEILPYTNKTDYPVNDRHWRLEYSDTIGAVTANFTLEFLDKRFLAVLFSFDSRGFDVIDDAFKSRYGKPTVEYAKPLSNAFGATFIDQRRMWQFKDVQILLMKYADAKVSSASIAKRAWNTYEDAEKTRKKTDAAKDL